MSAQKIKIAVFGDSISEGIGSRHLNYCKPLKEKLISIGIQVDITNYASSGKTIRHLNELKSKYEKELYDFVIIAYGNVDAMLRPDTNGKPNIYAHIPSRYKKTGMLNPRPYYSSKWYKLIIQHLDSWIRWNLNAILLRIQGAITWVPKDEFAELYKDAVCSLQKSAKHVILMSTVQVDEKYFPGTNEMYCEYNDIIEHIAKDNEACCFIDLFHGLNSNILFYDDTFHPNALGYQIIADLLLDVVIRECR